MHNVCTDTAHSMASQLGRPRRLSNLKVPICICRFRVSSQRTSKPKANPDPKAHNFIFQLSNSKHQMCRRWHRMRLFSCERQTSNLNAEFEFQISVFNLTVSFFKFSKFDVRRPTYKFHNGGLLPSMPTPYVVRKSNICIPNFASRGTVKRTLMGNRFRPGCRPWPWVL